MKEHSLRDLILLDFDGTCVNINSIAHLVGDWDEFHPATFGCPANEPVIDFVKRLQLLSGVTIAVVTGKPSQFTGHVSDWLMERGVIPDVILARGPLNSMPDAELKPWLVKEQFGEGWEDRVLFALEDRDKMVDAWRALGVTCFQCAESLY